MLRDTILPNSAVMDPHVAGYNSTKFSSNGPACCGYYSAEFSSNGPACCGYYSAKNIDQWARAPQKYDSTKFSSNRPARRGMGPRAAGYYTCSPSSSVFKLLSFDLISSKFVAEWVLISIIC